MSMVNSLIHVDCRVRDLLDAWMYSHDRPTAPILLSTNQTAIDDDAVVSLDLEAAA